MGICWCKQKNENYEWEYEGDPRTSPWQDNRIPNEVCNVEDTEKDSCLDSETVDNLVLETLGVIGTLVDK